jgi:hypothetical protein
MQMNERGCDRIPLAARWGGEFGEGEEGNVFLVLLGFFCLFFFVLVRKQMIPSADGSGKAA